MSRQFIVLFVLMLTAHVLFVIEPAFSSVAKPSVPEFTVKHVAHPYDVPSTTTTTIDQYTGEKKVVTTPGYHVENKSIQITIKNQPFTPYTDEKGREINLYYNVRVKGHFGEDWETVYQEVKIHPSHYPVQSSSEYTVLSLSADYPDDAKVDFQVKAMKGYYYDKLAGRPIYPLYALASVGSSDWSETQTITIGTPYSTTNSEIPEQNEKQTPTPSNTTTLGIPEQQDTEPKTENPYMFTFIAAGALILIPIAAGIGLLIHLIKRKQ